MIENVNKCPTSGNNEKQCVILGCWDHEKTPDLIKDLDTSVNLVEKKCKKLLQQLLYYRKYSDQFKDFNVKTYFKNIKANTQKKSQNPQYVSNSLPDVTFRKKILSSQQLEEIFQEKFKEKLCTINKELSVAADKMGLKEKMFFFSIEEYLKSLNEAVRSEMEKSLSKVKDDFIKMNYIKSGAKSEPTISNKTFNAEFSKITQDELDLYQKLSRISLSRSSKNFQKSINRKPVSSPVRRPALKIQKRRTKIIKRKVEHKNSPKGTIQPQKESNKSGLEGESKMNNKIKNSKTSKKRSKVKKENKKLKFSSNRSNNHKNHKNHVNHSKSTTSVNISSSQALNENLSWQKMGKNYSEIQTICNSLLEAIQKNNLAKQSEAQRQNAEEDKSNVKSLLLKKPIPFTSCISASKSFNIGMNIQQFLSLKKYKKTALKNASPISTKNSEKKDEQPIESKVSEFNQFNNDYRPQKPQNKYIADTYPWNPKKTKSTDFQRQEVSHTEHKENVWISKVTDLSDGRKARSKFTGNPPQRYVEYHKSTTRRYTNGQESMIKSESKSAYAVGSKIMVSDCQKTDFYKVDEKNNFYRNACGDNHCNEKCTKLRTEWSKAYNTFLNLHRRYNTLKEVITNNGLTPSELKSLEDEIDYAVEKYKEFLKFYSKFLHLKNQLNSLKIACETGDAIPVASLSMNSQKLLCSKPTSSMTFKKALRQVQVLQDNIRCLENC